ncbi:MAG: hypothetical protein GWO24_29455, partial [Akkermansiaceae bacterium]|nr:hypothetical protein [Akkermansiaceae bacterium]
MTLPDGTVVPKEVLQQAFVKFLDRIRARLQSGEDAGSPPTPRNTDDREMERPEPGEQKLQGEQPQQQQPPAQQQQAPAQ